MLERTFLADMFLKILRVDHIIEGSQFIGDLIRKIIKYGETPTKTWSVSTVLIKIKTEGFRSSESVRLGLVNWSFGFHRKILFVFPINLC